MKVCDIQRGEVCTIEVKPANGEHFEFNIPVKEEITLHQSDYMGEILLRRGNHACAVKGSDLRYQTLLTKIFHRNLHRLCWITGKIPKNGNIQRVILQIHEFPSRYIWPDAIDMGVDEKVVEHIRRKRGQLTSVESVVEWLTKKIIIPPNASEMVRVLLSGSPKTRPTRTSLYIPSAVERSIIFFRLLHERQYSLCWMLFSGELKPLPDQQELYEIPASQAGRAAFRLYGKGIAVDVIPVIHEKEDKFKVSRIVEARRASQNNEKRPVLLVEGKFRFCDMTIAGAFRGTARTELDQIVKEAGSYLGIWKEYNKLERENILARSREFGWLKYTEYEKLSDGRFRFTLKDGIDESLQYLSEK